MRAWRDGDAGLIRIAERLRVAHRAYADTVPDHPDLTLIPAVAGLKVVVVAEKVEVVEEEPLHPTVRQELIGPGSKRLVVVLVHGFVGLDVEAPVPVAAVERDVREVGVDLLSARVVPDGVDDLHARIVEPLDHRAGPVVPLSRRPRHGDHELIDHGEDRAKGLLERIVEGDGVPDEGEPGDAGGPAHARPRSSRATLSPREAAGAGCP